MAGIYIHIPFCKQACYYCDFHFSTSLKYKSELINALKAEIALQKDFLTDKTISTIYFGGGTPSLLSDSEIQSLIDTVALHYNITDDAEITLEANPDDLDTVTLKALRNTATNRLSIGVQSFIAYDLKWMNRAHTTSEAESSIKRAQDMGFENITIDLIYGLPHLTITDWQSNLEKAFQLQIPHFSAYCLTIEPKTALANFIQKGTYKMPNDDWAIAHFELLMDAAAAKGYDHYEISNFCLPNRQSKHNSNYWAGVPYLGIGPSAHSYQLPIRQWNIANNAAYIAAIEDHKIPCEKEILTPQQQSNEYLMVALRTQNGANITLLLPEHQQAIEPIISTFIGNGWIKLEQKHLQLTRSGKLYADKIASDLFLL